MAEATRRSMRSEDNIFYSRGSIQITQVLNAIPTTYVTLTCFHAQRTVPGFQPCSFPNHRQLNSACLPGYQPRLLSCQSAEHTISAQQVCVLSWDQSNSGETEGFLGVCWARSMFRPCYASPLFLSNTIWAGV